MWKPIQDRLLVTPFVPTTREIGQRILRADQTRERPQVGKVEAVGSTITQVQVGDLIAFGRFAGVEIQVSGRKLLIMREPEIMVRQGADELAITTHEVRDGDEVVAVHMHEATSYCQECDPMHNPDAETPAADLIVP